MHAEEEGRCVEIWQLLEIKTWKIHDHPDSVAAAAAALILTGELPLFSWPLLSQTVRLGATAVCSRETTVCSRERGGKQGAVAA